MAFTVTTATTTRPLTCKKGFRKKRVHGKPTCVRIKHHRKHHRH